MKTQEILLDQIQGTPNSKTIVLFGGSWIRRDEIIRLLSEGQDVTIYGTLNENEGMERLKELNDKVDVVLIGGRYTAEQRKRISHWVERNLPSVKLSRPGFDYPYENGAIKSDVLGKLGRQF